MHISSKSTTVEPAEKARVDSALRPRYANGRPGYQALLDAAPDAIVVVDKECRIVLVNAQAEALFGYRRAELIGQPADKLISEHSRGEHGTQHSRLFSEPRNRPVVTGLELFGLRKDGSEFPAEIRLSPVDTRQGVLVSSAIRDISERRRTEEDLRRLASIVESSDDAIIGKTLDGIITCWNAGAERMYGYPASEAIGRSVNMLIPGDRPTELHALLERLKNGETVDHFETMRVTKDGRKFDIELTVSPIRDATEKIVGGSAIGRDITKRKCREKDLSRLADVVESSEDAIIGKTLEGIVTHWNHGAERIYGYTASEMVGTSVSILVPPDRSVESADTLEKVRGGESVERSDAIRLRKDGTEVHMALMHAPIRDSDGQVIGVSTVARDITESKRIEDMLQQSQKMEAVGRLAGGVAHDFNNLLGVILGYTDLLLGRLGPEDVQRKEIEEIQKAGERAALLTRQLLAFSRKQVSQPKVMDLNAVIAGSENLLRRLIGEDVELVVQLNPSLCRVKADPGQVEQILMNLAVNARHAMPGGGKITVETSNVAFDEKVATRHASIRRGLHAMIAVTDTGCGMDENIKSHIFEPFFTTREFGKGTGLGLATVYGIVKQSGGSVWVYSEVGIGTTFKIYLPCAGAAAVDAPVAEHLPAKVDKGTQTILVVEDDAALLQVTSQSLREVGYTILQAGNAQEAIQIFASHPEPIDLMVTDVIMPGMNGVKLAAHFSSLRPEMKVLFVSGYTDDSIAPHGVLDPGLSFLQKPFSPKMLAHKVGDMLARRRPGAQPDKP